jgi:Protein of unknown function (DUF3455)
MKNRKSQAPQTTRRRILLIARVAALAVAFTVALSRPVYADRAIEPPPVPDDLVVPEGNKVFLVGHAVGTQNYICPPSGWRLFGPQATLFNDDDKQLITHFLSPNPDESGMARATWQDSRDTSTVWAVRIAESSDPDFVAVGAIPWFLLEVVGTEPGPTGGERLTRTTFIQRLNTSGGIVPPPSRCDDPADIGITEFVSYEADYFFHKAVKSK